MWTAEFETTSRYFFNVSIRYLTENGDENSMKLQRKDEIIKLISENRIVRANELSEYFQVSMETIRRDLV